MVSVTSGFLVACWCLLGLAFAGDPTVDVWNFMSVVSGVYDNRKQLDRGDTDHDYLWVVCKPVKVPVLNDTPALYCEYSVNGTDEYIQICLVTSNKKGTITMTVYYIADASKYKQGTFNTDDIAKLTVKDFADSKCHGFFEATSPTIWVGSWPVCTTFKEGERQVMYSDTLQCDYFIVIVPEIGKERPHFVPYEFNLVGDKFDVIGAPADYINPCKSSNQAAKGQY